MAVCLLNEALPCVFFHWVSSNRGLWGRTGATPSRAQIECRNLSQSLSEESARGRREKRAPKLAYESLALWRHQKASQML